MTEDLLLGKKLYKPLLHPVTGKVLLPAGTELTQAYLDRLARQGLTEELRACMEAPDPGALPGMPSVKDLDEFEIEIPDLPDLLLEFMPKPEPEPVPEPARAAAAAPPAPPPGWVPTGHAPPPAPPAPPGWAPPGAPPAPPQGWVPTGHAPAPAPPPGWAPPYGQPRPVPPPAPKAPEPPPARLPGANNATKPPQVASGPMRYYHNPHHVMPERAIMGMMQAVVGVEDSMRGGQLPAYDPLKRVVDEVIDRLGSNIQKLGQGIEIRVVNQPHDQSHPVNVFILSIAMGLAMGYDQAQLQTLGLAALCHDIGKSAIPREILDKVGPLTPHEVEMLRAHTLMGKRIMEKVSWATPLMARIVYEHHERNDGSGYPLRLQDHQIHEMSKIVAVAEVYDALISDTSYRGRFSPEVAYNSIRVGERTGLDAKVIRAFQRYIVPYPMHSFVMLDTQEIGQVVSTNRQNVFKPVVKIGGETVDLSVQSRRSIVTSHFQAY